MENFKKVLDVIPGKGINVENVSAQRILNEMCCAICLCFAWDAIECKECGAVYCMNCISEQVYLYKKDECPICKNNPFLMTNCRAFKRFFKSAQIICPNELCNSKIEYSDYYNHLNTCIFNEYKCKNEDCDYTNILKNKNELENHSKECIHRIVVCEYCLQKLKFSQLKKHQLNECREIM